MEHVVIPILNRIKDTCGSDLEKVVLSGNAQRVHAIEDVLALVNDSELARAPGGEVGPIPGSSEVRTYAAFPTGTVVFGVEE